MDNLTGSSAFAAVVISFAIAYGLTLQMAPTKSRRSDTKQSNFEFDNQAPHNRMKYQGVHERLNSLIVDALQNVSEKDLTVDSLEEISQKNSARESLFQSTQMYEPFVKTPSPEWQEAWNFQDQEQTPGTLKDAAWAQNETGQTSFASSKEDHPKGQTSLASSKDHEQTPSTLNDAALAQNETRQTSFASSKEVNDVPAEVEVAIGKRSDAASVQIEARLASFASSKGDSFKTGNLTDTSTAQDKRSLASFAALNEEAQANATTKADCCTGTLELSPPGTTCASIQRASDSDDDDEAAKTAKTEAAKTECAQSYQVNGTEYFQCWYRLSSNECKARTVPCDPDRDTCGKPDVREKLLECCDPREEVDDCRVADGDDRCNSLYEKPDLAYPCIPVVLWEDDRIEELSVYKMRQNLIDNWRAMDREEAEAGGKEVQCWSAKAVCDAQRIPRSDCYACAVTGQKGLAPDGPREIICSR